MSNGDPALVWSDPAKAVGPGTHVLIVGVGRYTFGKGPGATPVGSDLRQLTSPPISARAMADWFMARFENPEKPLASLSLLVSESKTVPYAAPARFAAAPMVPPRASFANVRAAAGRWAQRLATNKDNMAVFYFCGHGISQGEQAALLLDDFGAPIAEFDGAIALDVFRGTMKNSPAIQQLFLLDCCRTNADDFYKHETLIGSRIVSIPFLSRGHSQSSQPCVLFPTLDGEEAFGVRDDVSAFTRAAIDAMSFAAADPSSGIWQTTTGRIIDAVSTLIRVRVPQLTMRSTPQALDLTSFDFNVVPQPTETRSFVTISDLSLWGQVELECADPTNAAATQRKHSRDTATETCCTFQLKDGAWRFSGALPNSPPSVQGRDQFVRAPVAYITLQVTP
jgi:hypothetical protein